MTSNPSRRFVLAALPVVSLTATACINSQTTQDQTSSPTPAG